MFDAMNCFTLQTDGTLVQAITGDAVSTNILNLDVAGISPVNPSIGPYIIIKVVLAFVTLTSLEIKLETASDASETDLKQIAKWEFALASLTAGALIVNQMLPVWDFQQYLQLDFNVVGSDPGSGSTLFACLADGPETPQTDLDQVTL